MYAAGSMYWNYSQLDIFLTSHCLLDVFPIDDNSRIHNEWVPLKNLSTEFNR